jgi:Cu2+-exporting ATPase
VSPGDHIAAAAGAAKAAPPPTAETAETAETDFGLYVRDLGGEHHALDFMVEGVHCGGCVSKIERALGARPEVERARVNLSTRRLSLEWHGKADEAGDLVGVVTRLGYGLVPFDPERLERGDKAEEKELLRAMAVAGFAAANVMLLSISVWAGNAEDMGPVTRSLLHWFSALIALPAILYAGRPFFRSAWSALRYGRMNMDVPISLAVLLAGGMSLHEVATGGPHAYFDSAVTLLFFLLIGRYPDRRARGRARSAVERLLTLRTKAVTVLDDAGHRRHVPAEQVRAGEAVLVAAGERIGIDGRITAGRSEVDQSLITGESLPVAVAVGDQVFAGTVNGSAPLTVTVTGVGEDTLLAEIARLMETAEQRRARYVALADRIARLYAPVVHGLALATFVGWWGIAGAPWQTALLYAIAVLIITCPCALGLAVPAVQVIASGRLLRKGVLLKSGTALERFAEIDTVVFDKTGTLTEGAPEAALDPSLDDDARRLAAGMAAASKHPLARALARAVPDAPALAAVRETPGCGLAFDTPAGEARLGSRAWCGVDEDGDGSGKEAAGPELWLKRPQGAPVRFAFRERLRADAAEVIAALREKGLAVLLLSGDRAPTVSALAASLGIAKWRAAQTPADKVAALDDLARAGKRVLMVGDGLNDAPALAAAHVSLSPSSAADIAQTAADAVFQGRALDPVLEILAVARRARALVRQNLVLAFGYNAVTVPIAIAGLVTPLVAALAMSASSIVVVTNALRLGRVKRR